MPTEGHQTRQPWPVRTEGGLILIAAPFLLFPSLRIEATLLALLLVIAAWLLSWRSSLIRTPFNLVLLFFGLTWIVGILVTADPGLTLPKATGLILGLTAWRYLDQVIDDRRWLAWSLLAFVLLGLGFVILGTLNADWLAKVPLLTAIVDRFPALYWRLPDAAAAGVQPNQLAGTLLLYFPLPISMLIGQLSGKPGRLGLTAMVLASLLVTGLLLLTQSRSGWIGGAGGGLALLLLWGAVLPPSPRRKIVWLALVAMLVAGAIFLVVVGPERLQELWRDPQQETAVGSLGSVSFRQEVWRWSLMAVGDFPFTGTGLGTFRRVVRRLYPLAISPTYDIAHAHNIFLQVALDLGIPGLIAYLALLIVAGRLGWQVARQDETLRPLALGLIAGLAALHIYGLTDALTLGSKTGILFWMILGLLTGMRQITLVELAIPTPEGKVRQARPS